MAMDYLESGNYIIINHYRRFGNELVNFLLVVNRSGEILYHERTGSGSGIAMDSFFIMDNVLVFVRDKRNITGITLI